MQAMHVICHLLTSLCAPSLNSWVSTELFETEADTGFEQLSGSMQLPDVDKMPEGIRKLGGLDMLKIHRQPEGMKMPEALKMPNKRKMPEGRDMPKYQIVSDACFMPK